MSCVDGSALAAEAKAALSDASRFLFFDDHGTVLASSFTVNPSELTPLTAVFSERDEAVRQGLTVQGFRYEVHRHHPPLVYGRTMGCLPEESEGIAVCRVEAGATGHPCYGLITYQMPNISARMVPLLQAFCSKHLAAP